MLTFGVMRGLFSCWAVVIFLRFDLFSLSLKVAFPVIKNETKELCWLADVTSITSLYNNSNNGNNVWI